MWFCSELIEGHFEWEGAGGEIKTDGKTAGPRAQQSTVSRAWSRCWSNPAVSGSSHTSSPTEGSRPGSLSTRTSSERWWGEGLNSEILRRKRWRPRYLRISPWRLILCGLKWFLTSDRKSGATCDKLQEKSLLLCIKTAQHLKQEPHCTATDTTKSVIHTARDVWRVIIMHVVITKNERYWGWNTLHKLKICSQFKTQGIKTCQLS